MDKGPRNLKLNLDSEICVHLKVGHGTVFSEFASLSLTTIGLFLSQFQAHYLGYLMLIEQQFG